MKLFIGLFVFSLFIGCRQQNKTPIEQGPTNTIPQVTIVEDTIFFPVTRFIKGRIIELTSGGINPLKRTLIGDKKDSAWLNMKEVEAELHEFTFPEIDSANLRSLFVQRSFLDQTIGAYTFSYDPRKPLPDSFSLRRWDVYVIPETEKISRIFLVKNKPGNRQLQLTWQNDSNAKIVEIANTNTNPTVEKITTISWNVNE